MNRQAEVQRIRDLLGTRDARAIWITATAGGSALAGGVWVSATMAFPPATPTAGASSAHDAGALAALLVVPLLERWRPRRRAMTVLVVLAGSAMLALFALAAGLARNASALPCLGSASTFATLVAGAFLGDLVGLASLGSYVGCLDQPARVHWLLWRGLLSLAVSSASTAFPFLFAEWAGKSTCQAVLTGCGLMSVLLITSGLVAGFSLPEFGNRDAPSGPSNLPSAYFAPLAELPTISAAWICLVTLVLVRLSQTLATEAGPQIPAVAAARASVAAGVSETPAAFIGLLIAWTLARRTPIQKLIWTTSLALLTVPAAWGLAAILRPTSAWLVYPVGRLVSSYLGCILFVLVLRVFGSARNYLSLCAVATIVPGLIAGAVSWLYHDVCLVGPIARVALGVVLSVVAASWALVAWKRSVKQLEEPTPCGPETHA